MYIRKVCMHVINVRMYVMNMCTYVMYVHVCVRALCQHYKQSTEIHKRWCEN